MANGRVRKESGKCSHMESGPVYGVQCTPYNITTGILRSFSLARIVQGAIIREKAWLGYIFSFPSTPEFGFVVPYTR